MSVVIDGRVVTVAAKAAVKAQLGPNNVYSFGQEPGVNGNAGVLPGLYVLLGVERMYVPSRTMSAQAGTTGWRVQARCVGSTADEAEWALFHVGVALNEQALTVGDLVSTPAQLESTQAVAYDDTRYSGLAIYTLNL